MTRFGDVLSAFYGLLVSRGERSLDEVVALFRKSFAEGVALGPDPSISGPPWDPADAAAPDWSLRLHTITFPPGSGMNPQVVIVDLWLDGRGRYVEGDPAEVRKADTALPHSTGRALLTMVDQAFPDGFKESVSCQNGRMVLFDGTPATLTIFRRQPYAFVEAHTNLGFIGEFEGETPAPPVLEVCELLWRLHQDGYRPG